MKECNLLTIIFCFFLFASCSKDKNNITSCNGISDFVAVWSMSDHCGSNDFEYALTITENSIGGIKLANVGGLGQNYYVNATVTGATFNIAPQMSQTYVFSGNGSLNAGCAQLTLSWRGGPGGECSGTGTK